ncbi:MAG: SCO family protein [Anaerolineales bacterium]|nr:SCO family protein [Anaerolineales bacterium]
MKKPKRFQPPFKGGGALFGLLLLLFLLSCQTAPPHEFAGTRLSAPHPAPDFELASAAGPVHLSDYEGDYVFVYFGYTFCPDVCPITLQTLKNVKDGLSAEEAERMQVIMVTVDPERDTPERLAEYMDYFDSAFVGLSGEVDAIDAAAEPFGVFYEKQEGSAATGYLVNHTARFFLIDPSGDAIIAYPHSTTAAAVTADLNYLMEYGS